jgi:hypothetical protein
MVMSTGRTGSPLQVSRSRRQNYNQKRWNLLSAKGIY